MSHHPRRARGSALRRVCAGLVALLCLGFALVTGGVRPAVADPLPALTAADVTAIEFQDADAFSEFKPVPNLDLTDPVLVLDSPSRTEYRTQIRVTLAPSLADRGITFELRSIDPVADPVTEELGGVWMTSVSRLSSVFYATGATKTNYRATKAGVGIVRVLVDGFAPLDLQVRFNAGPRPTPTPSPAPAPTPTPSPTPAPAPAETLGVGYKPLTGASNVDAASPSVAVEPAGVELTMGTRYGFTTIGFSSSVFADLRTDTPDILGLAGTYGSYVVTPLAEGTGRITVFLDDDRADGPSITYPIIVRAAAPAPAPAPVPAGTPVVEFRGNDGTVVAAVDQVVSLGSLASGSFHLTVDGVEVANPIWTSVEQYHPQSAPAETAWHFWIDQGNRFNPRSSTDGQPATVTWTRDGVTVTTPFTIKVAPSGIEEIRVLVDGRVVEPGAPIQLAGSAWQSVTVEGRLAGETTFRPLPETSWRIQDQPGILVQGGRFQVWWPGAFQLTVAMRDVDGATIVVPAVSSHVPVTGLQGDVPATWTIDRWDLPGAVRLGIRASDDLASGYTLRVLPDNASIGELVWTALTPDIAYYEPLHSRGIVPLRAGTARFLVTSADNPAVSREVSVTFGNAVPVTALAGPGDITMQVGQSLDVALSAQPTNATDARVAWTFDRPDVVAATSAFVAGSHGAVTVAHRITAHAAGLVRVTATPVDTTAGAAPVTFTVTVVAPQDGATPPAAATSEPSPVAGPDAAAPGEQPATDVQSVTDVAMTPASEPAGAASSTPSAAPVALAATGGVASGTVAVALGSLLLGAGLVTRQRR